MARRFYFFLLGVSSCILRALRVRIVHRAIQRFHGGTQSIYVLLGVSSCFLRALRVRNISQSNTEASQSGTEVLFFLLGVFV